MELSIDFQKEVGKIKPIHGVGQPPLLGAQNHSMFHYLTEAGIPSSRLHDVGGEYGGNKFVDIPNIFRDFDADETLPESYDFAFTDTLITALMEAECEPFFRLGVTIENNLHVKAYRIFPPKDFGKWARVCEHVIRHYTEGWANGFYYDIKYFEIWNEPDDTADIPYNPMWQGTKEEYFALYVTTAKHLKKCFPHIKIGGYGCCGFYEIAGGICTATDHEISTQYFLDFFEEFLAYIKEKAAPLDFFSWHSYDDSIEHNVAYAKYARERLDHHGFFATENICDEWNVNYDARGTLFHAAKIAAMLLAFQKSPLDASHYYDAQCTSSIYGGLFNCLTRTPYPAYYAFTAFNRLYRMQAQIEVKGEEEGIYAVGAREETWACVVIANPTGEEKTLSFLSDKKPHRFVVTDSLGVDRECYSLSRLPGESIVSVYFDLR